MATMILNVPKVPIAKTLVTTVPHIPWLYMGGQISEPQINVLESLLFPCEAQKYMGDPGPHLGSLPLPGWPVHGGKAGLNCRGSGHPLNAPAKRGLASPERSPRGGDSRPRRMGKWVFHMGQQQIQGGKAATGLMNPEANLRYRFNYQK